MHSVKGNIGPIHLKLLLKFRNNYGPKSKEGQRLGLYYTMTHFIGV